MKLTDDDVADIRAAYQAGTTRAQLARRYGVSRTYVTHIILGQRRTGRREPEPLDEVAVQRACAGERVPLSVQERREVVRRLTERGWSARRIAEVVQVSTRSVTRHRGAA